MAEEGVSLPVTPEISKPDGNNLRRSSTGKVSSSNGGETIVPHYLRASTGSCHDFCKYGRAHAMEAKATHPVRKRVVKKSPDREDLLGSVDLQDSEMAAVELKLSSDSKSQTSDFSSVIKEEVSKQSLAGKNPTGTEVLWQRKKTSGVKFKSSAPMKCRPSDTPKIMKEEVSSSSEKVEVLFVKRSLKAKNLSSSAAYATSLKPKSLTARNLSSSVDYATSLKPKSLTAKNLSSSVDYSTSLKPKSLTAKNLSSSADYASSLKPKSLAVKPATSLKPKSLAVKPPTSLKPKALTVKPPTSLKPKALTVKPATTLMPNSVTVTPATSLKPKSSTGKPISSANTSGIGRSLRKGDAKVGKTTGPKVAIKKALPSPTASLSSKVSVNSGAGLSERKHRELKDVSPLLNESEIEKAEPKKPSTDEVEEKTLYVIKMETENKPLESDQNEAFATEFSPALSPSPKFLSIPDAMETENKPLESDQNEAFATEFSPGLSPSPKFSSTPNALSSSSYEEESQDVSECMTSEAEWDSLSEDNELENIQEADTLEEGYKDGSTKARMLSSEEKNCQPMKLNFRRGKVIDVHSVDDRPRRLKFRRGKLSGNQNVRAGARKRSFTRTKAAGGDMESSEPDSQKVVLRHQDVQGKKDAQGLFNNVIEETASKLVATRKSKVKALVGAFETVISLQDKNPAANAVE